MQRFAKLIQQVINTTKTNDKRDALVRYFEDAPDADRLWMVALFTGRRPRRVISSTLLSQWCLELVNLPGWLFSESYGVVGDLAETISLMLPAPTKKETTLSLADMMEEFRKLQKADDEGKKAFVLNQWQRLDQPFCLVFNKLITGGFRIGVSQNLVIQAISMYTGKEIQAVAHMISGSWDPYTTSFSDLIHESVVKVDTSKPYLLPGLCIGRRS